MSRLSWVVILGGLAVVGGAWGSAGAQSGPPGPGWVQLDGGGWVPPDHPLAAGRTPESAGGPGCGNRSLRGTYGIHMQGSRPVPPAAGGGVEAVIGVVIRTYDGAGGFTQVDNIKGAVTGLVPDREGFGTYYVNPDCTGATQFQPGPGVLLEERFVIVDGGREVHSITVSPQPVMVTAVQQRIDRR